MPFIETPGVRPVIVALSGYQEHGKTTAAQWLVDHHGFVRTSFADPIRRALCAATGVSVSVFVGPSKLEPCAPLGGLTPRAAMEKLGDWGRTIDPEFWCKAWDATKPLAPLLVVDDARYDLEIEWIFRHSLMYDAAMVMIEVDRPGWSTGTAHSSNRLPAAAEGRGKLHEVTNDDSIAALGAKVEAVLREYL